MSLIASIRFGIVYAISKILHDFGKRLIAETPNFYLTAAKKYDIIFQIILKIIVMGLYWFRQGSCSW